MTRRIGDELFSEETVYLQDPVTGGRKGSKVARFNSIPVEALAELACVYGKGEIKYPNDPETGQPNWIKGMPYSWNVDAMDRHINKWRAGESFDSDDGLHHLAHAAWHLFALMTYEARDVGTDDRQKTNLVGGTTNEKIIPSTGILRDVGRVLYDEPISISGKSDPEVRMHYNDPEDDNDNYQTDYDHNLQTNYDNNQTPPDNDNHSAINDFHNREAQGYYDDLAAEYDDQWTSNDDRTINNLHEPAYYGDEPF